MRICGQSALQGEKKPPEAVVRSAEQPGQAVNVDLCFVPAEHACQEKLPAVSGSSGHLVVERSKQDGEEPRWPGQVFAEAELDYTEAMLQYVEATLDRLVHLSTERKLEPQEPTRWRQEWEGRAQRYQVREQRKREDAAWKAAKGERRSAKQAYQSLPKPERQQQREAWQVADQAWRKLREQRRATLLARQQEDEVWHQRNRELKASLTGTSAARQWIAVLVVTDNCTRQCLGLPIFRTGPKVTSKELTTALGLVLPEDLEFLISDQGTPFRSVALAQLAEVYGFIQVPIYRHRPESNGIAERFVLTLKDWLRSKSWQSSEELEVLLGLFQPEYNDRPHQGLAIPGLSPNEFANRIWLM
jgi:transposase InsO family protein